MIENKNNTNENSESESELDSNNLENSNDGLLDQKSEIQNNQSEIVNNYDLSENLDDKNNTKKDILESTENRIIHKKEGRLHIYVRQDKYKGELKSKNWVGRAFLDGKQVVHSSRTQNLDEAIPILEKWFDESTSSSSKVESGNNETNHELNEQPHTQKIESQLRDDK